MADSSQDTELMWHHLFVRSVLPWCHFKIRFKIQDSSASISCLVLCTLVFILVAIAAKSEHPVVCFTELRSGLVWVWPFTEHLAHCPITQNSKSLRDCRGLSFLLCCEHLQRLFHQFLGCSVIASNICILAYWAVYTTCLPAPWNFIWSL